MGPRGSALVCGHTTYHSLLETALADLKKKDVYNFCPFLSFDAINILYQKDRI